MSKNLMAKFKRYTDINISKIHIKKKNDFAKDLESFMRLNRNTFDKHFKLDPKTSTNPVYKIDAMIWSTIYFEKVERYEKRVFRFAEYALNAQSYYKNLSYEDLQKGVFTISPWRLRPHYYELITAVNPPLTKEEFEKELDSDQPIKKFFYTYDDPDYKMPLDVEKNEIINRRFLKVRQSMGRTFQKYRTFDSFDYFSELEDKEKEKKKNEKKYIWSGQKPDLDLSLFANEGIDDFRKHLRENSNIKE